MRGLLLRAFIVSGSDFLWGLSNSNGSGDALDELCAQAHNLHSCVISDIEQLSDLTHNNSVSDLARDPKQIGNLIRRARKRRGLSQGALGAKAGLRQETISLIENGNGAAKLETMLKVLSALDLEFRIALRSKGDLGIESNF